MTRRQPKDFLKYTSDGNVIDDLGFSPERAAVVKLKAEILNEIISTIEEMGLSRRQLERIFDEPQPRISELLRGKISKISVDKLAAYLFLLGKRVVITTKARTLTAEEKEKLVA